MGKIEIGGVERLHYALTDSQCNNCGAQLQWKPVFDNVNLPRYTAAHCGQLYTMNVETVKFDVASEKKSEKEHQIEEKKALENKEPRAILMAEGKKKKDSASRDSNRRRIKYKEKKDSREAD